MDMDKELSRQFIMLVHAETMLRRCGEPGSMMYKIWDERGQAITKDQFASYCEKYPEAAIVLKIDNLAYRDGDERVHKLAKKALKRIYAGELPSKVEQDLVNQLIPLAQTDVDAWVEKNLDSLRAILQPKDNA